MKQYIDKSFMTNPLGEYLKWLTCKTNYQLKNWGKHLRIGYLSVVSNCSFGHNNILGSHCMVINSVMGDFSYINSFSYVQHTTMGKYCSIGPNVKIAPGKHPTSVFVSTHPVTFGNQKNLKNYTKEQKFSNYKRVTIGNDVWICANAIIIDGITIGDGAIITANSVVVKDVGAYEIVGGNPAKLLKKRFDDKQIEYLQDTKWWNNDEMWMRSNISKFWDIENFVEYSNVV
ncbi:CatB-related O-acetyltransferase [Mucilaginibacter aquaedulcis]|uniref:CatB-related O-acetyltransferase n=1 Tax=Mucilaginibacter aquaedulcis TaxID=1187081 RepID=UPI0025B31019|nr:CatB-related O-acetyltransferase [Mucilaginibacter aquaedulcis]MDN3548558.1 CatB-related O-acetyltransferase [Mucilaginibacter aquaedulcis]